MNARKRLIRLAQAKQYLKLVKAQKPKAPAKPKPKAKRKTRKKKS